VTTTEVPSLATVRHPWQRREIDLGGVRLERDGGAAVDVLEVSS
jgi:hypothetical protein